MIALELGHPIVEGTPDEVIHDQRVVSSYLGGDLASINRSGASSKPSGKEDAPDGPKGSVRVRRSRPLSAKGRK